MDGYKNILIILPEGLHREFTMYLAMEGRTKKDFYITATQHFVKLKKNEQAEKNKHKKDD